MPFTAGSKLRASDLASIDPRGTFSRYTSSTAIAAAATTVLAPTLAQGSQTGLSLASSLFTLGAGIWTVTFGWQSSLQGATTVLGLSLIISSDNTASATSNVLTGGTATADTLASNFLTGSATTEILSDGTATAAFKIFSGTSGPGGSAGNVRITFSRKSTS